LYRFFHVAVEVVLVENLIQPIAKAMAGMVTTSLLTSHKSSCRSRFFRVPMANAV
jgi:hypothetical protein